MTATGKCAKCGKKLELGLDGSCKHCNAEICWDCWVTAKHECPMCGNFDALANAPRQVLTRSGNNLDADVGP